MRPTQMLPPQYTRERVETMSNAELADELSSWADARDSASENRVRHGKSPLDSLLLREVAHRLDPEPE